MERKGREKGKGGEGKGRGKEGKGEGCVMTFGRMDVPGHVTANHYERPRCVQSIYVLALLDCVSSS